jgi:hypothetical protein
MGPSLHELINRNQFLIITGALPDVKFDDVNNIMLQMDGLAEGIRQTTVSQQ